MPGEPAIGLVELTSVARGIVACDAMAKRAPVTVARAQTICPGKYIILVAGEEQSVREAMDEGTAVADGYLVDRLLIPNLHPKVLPALVAAGSVKMLDSVGVIETYSVATTVVAADAACKAARIELLEIRLGTGLGGKAFVTMTGELHMIEAAVQAGVAAIDSGMLMRSEVIPAPHPDLGKALL